MQKSRHKALLTPRIGIDYMELEQRKLLNFMPFLGSGYSVAFSVEELTSLQEVGEVIIFFWLLDFLGGQVNDTEISTRIIED